jgi:glycine cleavage system H protein
MVKVNDYELIEGRYYSEDHLWVNVEDSLVRVGITDYAQKSLREVVFAELPDTGSEVTQKESFGTLESVKAVSDLVAPISGTIKEVNTKISDSPEVLNEDPYGEGWLLLVEPKDLDKELKSLMDLEAAKDWLAKIEG